MNVVKEYGCIYVGTEEQKQLLSIMSGICVLLIVLLHLLSSK